MTYNYGYFAKLHKDKIVRANKYQDMKDYDGAYIAFMAIMFSWIFIWYAVMYTIANTH